MATATRTGRVARPPASRSRRRPARRRRTGPRSGRATGLLLLAAIVAAAVAGGVALTSHGRRSAAGPPVGCRVASLTGTGGYTLSPVQAQNASIIAAVALKMGLADHAVTVGLATALRESRLQDLTYGDRDSVGLFQQRPSEGWGTSAQILDPVYATTAFYEHLVQVPGWETMAVTDAAQSVQHSATPRAYAPWESEARSLAAALTGETVAAFSCRLDGYSGAAPAVSALPAAATQELGSPLLGTPVTAKVGWQVASWAVGHAWRYHVQTVTFGAWTWTAATGRWVSAADAPAGPQAVQVAYGS